MQAQVGTKRIGVQGQPRQQETLPQKKPKINNNKKMIKEGARDMAQRVKHLPHYIKSHKIWTRIQTTGIHIHAVGWWHAYNPSTWEIETGSPLQTGSLDQLNHQTLGYTERSCLRYKVGRDRGRHLASTAGLHMHVDLSPHMHVHIGRYTYSHTHGTRKPNEGKKLPLWT